MDKKNKILILEDDKRYRTELVNKLLQMKNDLNIDCEYLKKNNYECLGKINFEKLKIDLPDIFIIDLYNPPQLLRYRSDRKNRFLKLIWRNRTWLKFLYYIYFFPKYTMLKLLLNKVLKETNRHNENYKKHINSKLIEIYPWGGINLLLFLAEKRLEVPEHQNTLIILNSMYLYASENIWKLDIVTPRLSIILDKINQIFKNSQTHTNHTLYTVIPKMQEKFSKILEPWRSITVEVIQEDVQEVIDFLIHKIKESPISKEI